MQAVEQFKQINLQSAVSWVLAGLVTIALTLVSQQMNDTQRTMEKISDRLINHEIEHPDRALDKRLSILEDRLNQSQVD